jgi:hypothetical protein
MKGKKAGKIWAKSKTLLQNFLFLPVLSFWCITKDARNKKGCDTSEFRQCGAKRVATLY